MNQEITIEQVRKEIAELVNLYPERTGSVPDTEYKELADCVYYLDEVGEMISKPFWNEEEGFDPNTVNLVTPVCIIGQWVESYHPQLKHDEKFKSVLVRNAILGCTSLDELPFGQEVKSFLSDVQQQQDGPKPWGELDLNF